MCLPLTHVCWRVAWITSSICVSCVCMRACVRCSHQSSIYVIYVCCVYVFPPAGWLALVRTVTFGFACILLFVVWLACVPCVACVCAMCVYMLCVHERVLQKVGRPAEDLPGGLAPHSGMRSFCRAQLPVFAAQFPASRVARLFVQPREPPVREAPLPTVRSERTRPRRRRRDRENRATLPNLSPHSGYRGALLPPA